MNIEKINKNPETEPNNTLIYETPDNDPEIKEFFQDKSRESARGIVRKPDTNEIYIFLKSKTGQYKLPGGGLHEGETPKEGFVREVEEETGCAISNIQQIGITKTFAQKSNVFTADATAESDFNPDEEEIKAGAQKLTMSPQEATQHIQRFLDNLDLNTMEGKIAYTISHRDLKILEYYISHSV